MAFGTKQEKEKKGRKQIKEGPKPPFWSQSRTIRGELYCTRRRDPDKPPPEREGEGEQMAGEEV